MKQFTKELFSKNNSYYEPDSSHFEASISSKTSSNSREQFLLGVLEKFKSRRSIRKFSDREVPWHTIHDILDAAFNAPTAGNVQNSWVLLVEDKVKRHELGKMAFQQFWLSEAPLLLIVIRDDYHLTQMYPQEGKTYSIQNASALIENILMLAHFYDLGACWVEAYDNEVLKEYLGIPLNLKVDAIIPIGYPKENPKISKPLLSEHLFFETFGNKTRK